MSLLLKGLKCSRINLGGEAEAWFCYLFTLAFQDVCLVCHIYRLLDVMMEKADKALRERYLLRLKKKTLFIESKYTETLFQIWHYYVITKQMEQESAGKDWKQRIMFSRWWLPLMKVRMADSYNYFGFMQSGSFPDVIADLIED